MIAISLTAHEHPRAILELMSNIRYTYNRNAFLILHVSKSYRESFFRDAAKLDIRTNHPDIYWNDIEMTTKWPSMLPTHISNFLYASTKIRREFSHFQILSPSNLIVGTNMDQYIENCDILLNNAGQTSNNWYWHNAASEDKLYKKFRDENNLGDSLCARVDAVAIRYDIFSDFARKLLDIYSFDTMRSLDPIYPMEETLIPTFLSRYRQFGYKINKTRSKTFEPNEPALTVETVEKIIAENEIAYLKRIDANPNDPVRKFILSKRSYGLL